MTSTKRKREPEQTAAPCVECGTPTFLRLDGVAYCMAHYAREQLGEPESG